MRPVRGALPLLIFFLIVLFFATNALGTVLGTQYPLLVVASGSMRPTLEVGDIIIVEGVDYESIHASPTDGDVVVYRDPRPFGSELIVHRAVDKTPLGLITKGDANQRPDPWSPIPPNYVVGKWTGIKIPYWTGLGYLSLLLKSPPLRDVAYVIVLALIAVNLALIIRGRKKGDQKSTF